eukprot:SAG31_NODE_8188_length_1500_cov_3.294076_1_plen_389_part_10
MTLSAAAATLAAGSDTDQAGGVSAAAFDFVEKDNVVDNLQQEQDPSAVYGNSVVAAMSPQLKVPRKTHSLNDHKQRERADDDRAELLASLEAQSQADVHSKAAAIPIPVQRQEITGLAAVHDIEVAAEGLLSSDHELQQTASTGSLQKTMEENYIQVSSEQAPPFGGATAELVASNLERMNQSQMRSTEPTEESTAEKEEGGGFDKMSSSKTKATASAPEQKPHDTEAVMSKDVNDARNRVDQASSVEHQILELHRSVRFEESKMLQQLRSMSSADSDSIDASSTDSDDEAEVKPASRPVHSESTNATAASQKKSANDDTHEKDLYSEDALQKSQVHENELKVVNMAAGEDPATAKVAEEGGERENAVAVSGPAAVQGQPAETGETPPA